eukprot:59471-Chlamydomonas_euryale.AAC.1
MTSVVARSRQERQTAEARVRSRAESPANAFCSTTLGSAWLMSLGSQASSMAAMRAPRGKRRRGSGERERERERGRERAREREAGRDAARGSEARAADMRNRWLLRVRVKPF